MYTYEDPTKQAAAGGLTEVQLASITAQKDMRARAIDRGYQNMANFGGIQPESEVEQNLEGATIKFGTGGEWTYDTGIPWSNKKSLAGAIGFGDQVGDVWRGIKQLLQEQGLADDLIDVDAQDENENILRGLYADPEFGAAAMGGAVAGAIAEPVGLLMPIGKAKSVGTAILAGAVLGGAYGSALYVDGNESRLHNAALSAALMGPLAGVAQRFFRQTVGDDVAERVFNATDEEVITATARVNKQAEAEIAKRSSPEYMAAQAKAEREAMDATPGMTAKFERAEEELAREFTEQYPKTKAEYKRAEKIVKKEAKAALKAAGYKKKKKTKEPEEVIEDLETKAAMEGKRHSKVSQTRAWVDSVLQPLYDNVRRYSSKVAHGLRDADAIQHRRQHVWTQAVKPLQNIIKQMTPEVKLQLKRLLSNGGFNKATMTFIRQHAGNDGNKAVAGARDVLDEIFSKYKDVGYAIGKGRPDYFPLAVKDLEGLRKKEMSALDAVYAREQARQGGRALTPNQKSHIAEHYFTFDMRYSTTSGSLKKRMKQNISDEDLAFYHEPSDALHYYIHTAAEDIAKREFFKSFGHKPKGKAGLSASGTDIDDSITSLIDQIKKDVPGYDAQQEITRLLRSRFSADVHKTHKFVQAIKNISYAGTLGNYWSAMTQIGDLVFAFHKYGIKATVGAMLGPKVTSRAELGVEKAMAELQSETQGFTTKLADFAFKWSGFDMIDRFGKNVNINAALRSNRELAMKNPEKFIAKYGEKFGDQTDSLLRELQRMKMTKGNSQLSDNMYLMLWNELADTQPIGLAEMPQKYLDMPNGRIAYAYKTFAMKQLNYMRNMINNEKNPFTKGYNLTMFATMFVAANSSIDGFKDFMAGKPVDMNDKIFDNIVSLVGTSKYAVDKSAGLGSIIMQGLAPVPLTQGQKVLDSVTGSSKSWTDVVSDAANWTPIAGKLKKEYLD